MISPACPSPRRGALALILAGLAALPAAGLARCGADAPVAALLRPAPAAAPGLCAACTGSREDRP